MCSQSWSSQDIVWGKLPETSFLTLSHIGTRKLILTVSKWHHFPPASLCPWSLFTLTYSAPQKIRHFEKSAPIELNPLMPLENLYCFVVLFQERLTKLYHLRNDLIWILRIKSRALNMLSVKFTMELWPHPPSNDF